jgi:hypothetical protein
MRCIKRQKSKKDRAIAADPLEHHSKVENGTAQSHVVGGDVKLAEGVKPVGDEATLS